MRKLVVLESPYRGSAEGETAANIIYARKAVDDSLSRSEAPIASHLLYTQEGILDDSILKERLWGIEAGLAWIKVADACVVYIDRGISPGMCAGIVIAVKVGIPLEFRQIENF